MPDNAERGSATPHPEASAGEISQRVDRLLHDAEHADSGAMMARIMRDHGAEKKFEAEKAALIEEANRIDPKHAAYAWEESDV